MVSLSPNLVNVLRLRENVLDTLEETPKSKAELVETLSVSRSTVNRAVRQLRHHGLVEDTKSGIALSPVGKSALDTYRRFETRLESIAKWSDVLNHLPSRSQFDPALLSDATFTPAEPPVPDEPVEAMTELTSKADWLRVVSPVVHPRRIDTIFSRVTTGTLEAELVLGSEAIEYLRQSLPQRLADATSTSRLIVRESSDPIPFGIVHGSVDGTDEIVHVAIYDSDGFLYGVFETNSPIARRAATTTWRPFRRTTSRIDDADRLLSGLPSW